MHVKDNSTDRLVKKSGVIREEITRDVLEIFGIYLCTQELTHHAKTKPVWTQQIQNNQSLKNSAISK